MQKNLQKTAKMYFLIQNKLKNNKAIQGKNNG